MLSRSGRQGEFDYSGSQAIKALKEHGAEVVLVNPNIATNQTSTELADKVYFVPVEPDFVEKIIAKEQPDSIMLAWGGQTALNCGVQLKNAGVLEKYNVQVLGTPVEVIEKTEDRQLFNEALEEIAVHYPKSIACENADEARAAVRQINYPVMVRAAFTLGGGGSGFAKNDEEFEALINKAFAFSPQILVEESIKGWKEVEYEVVRDAKGNKITVCNMENFDPLGVHTGESIVIAPSQTLNNHEYQKLRTIALKVIEHLGIVGECNIQYALDPHSDEYRVIEVNARLSRSSALASKATGYPLAYVAAEIALGKDLPEIRNQVTGSTSAMFEPSLDYVAVKIPRWDLNKFRKVTNKIGSEMKSVREVMALGRSFEEAVQKGFRMLNIGAHGLTHHPYEFKCIETEMIEPTPARVFAVTQALADGQTPQEIHDKTKIDRWFLEKLQHVVDISAELQRSHDSDDARLLKQAKQAGFSDAQIEKIWSVGLSEQEVRTKRKELGILPVVKKIDTLAGEYPADTNYMYFTYHGSTHDLDINTVTQLHKKNYELEITNDNANQKSKIKNQKSDTDHGVLQEGLSKPIGLVLGGGPYSIGSSVEFDWCCVNAIKGLRRKGYATAMVNSNPETVSTDYEECDLLFFDELSLERVLDVIDLTNPQGTVLFGGGQVPNNLAPRLGQLNVPIFGTHPDQIDQAEDRQKFGNLCDKLGIDQPEWEAFATLEDAEKFADKVGYPVLVRPSKVLSGAAMAVARNLEELEGFLGKAAKIDNDAPVVVSKFEVGAREIEFDGVAHDGETVLYAISEHVENAGVHSGDATLVLPPQKTYLETIRRIKYISKQLAKELKITGPFNIQFLAKNNSIKVIELNLRASRSFPFVSKITGTNFIDVATRCALGEAPDERERLGYNTLDLDHVGVKCPQFSFSRLSGADPVLSVEMSSTGEVGCFGKTFEEAFLLAMISVGFQMPTKGVLFSVGHDQLKFELASSAKFFKEKGYKVYATPGTAEAFAKQGAEVHVVEKLSADSRSQMLNKIAAREIDLVVNIPKNFAHEEMTDGYQIRRTAIDNNVGLLTNGQLAKALVQCLRTYPERDDLPVRDWGNL